MPRWLKISVALLFVLVIAVASLPWWIGAAARPLLAGQGLVLTNPRALGFRTLHIDEARFVRGNTTAVVRDIQIPSPLFWLSSSSRRASGGTWSVIVKAATTPVPPSPGGIEGMPSLQERLLKIARGLQHWLPQASVGAGEVRWPGGGLTLAGATWEKSVLAGRDVGLLGQTFDLAIDASSPASWGIEARQPARDAHAKLQWHADRATGAATIWGQPLQLEITFPATGWLPEHAQASAENWSVPAERAGLGAQYTVLTGGGTLAWQDRAFTLSAQAGATPKAGITAPPLTARLEARGDLQGFTLTAVRVDAPFAQATLSAPLVIPWRGKPANTAAQLSIEADLSRQTWLEASGRVSGSVTVAPGGRQEFSLLLEGAGFRGFAMQRAVTRGYWDGHRLVVEHLEMEIDSSTRARAAGAVDWVDRQFVGVTFAATAHAAAFSRWLPAGTTWTEAVLEGTVEGPLAAPRHTGTIRTSGAQTGPLKPFDLTGNWRGAGATIDDFSAVFTAVKSRLQVTGGADATGLLLREVVFVPGGVEQLSLVAPVRVGWSPEWQINGARWQGPNATLALDVTTGPRGSFHLSAAHLDKEWIHDWLDLRGPTWRVQQLDFAGQMAGPTLDFTASLQGEIHLPGRDVAQVALAATGDREGTHLTELTISEAGVRLTEAHGRIAATWNVDGERHLHIDQGAPLELQATLAPDSPLWAALGEPAGIVLTGASAQARLKGTLARPEGELTLRVDSLKVASDSRWRDRVPDITALALSASGDRAEVRVDSFQASVEGQEIRGRGRVPMADDRWRQLVTTPAAVDWRQIDARVEIPGADLAVLARRFPQFFAARGTLQAELELARGGQLSGSLRVRDGATRPLPALGVMQDITAEVRFADRTARVESFAGRLGGEPVQLAGSIELPRDAAPRPDLHLTGKNIPLVRKAGLLVRADVDLRAQTQGARTRITGQVNLRDCLVLADISDLLPTGLRGARRQAPYFSVTTEPFDRWGLEVELRGTSVVRMRTPFFTGSGSAHFTLGGNLGEPRAVGEITVEEGRMFFPFATFTVENGAIRLKAADPFTPELALNAISRRHNYELRLEASGPPEAPVLVFTSNPAMEAGQVLLMVMAGQLPANETTGTPGQGGLHLTQLGAYLGQGIYRGLGGTDENRLEIVSGERISRQGRETYEVEYKLGERWALVGEYDEFDSYNAGLKWRIYHEEAHRAKK